MTKNGFECSCGRLGALVLLAFAGHVAAQDAPPVEVPTDADGVQRVSIVGSSYTFKPARIVAKAGRPLAIAVSMEEGIVPHNFVLDGPDGKPLADVALSVEPRTLQFELAPGRYPFYCSNRLLFFKSHRERGMSGTLEVRE